MAARSDRARRLRATPPLTSDNTDMRVVHVHIRVKLEYVEDFIHATRENARNSVQEPGISRFDFFQQSDDPTRFILNEVYRTEEAPAAHKATAHYLKWQQAVADMLVEPRTRVTLTNVFPADKDF